MKLKLSSFVLLIALAGFGTGLLFAQDNSGKSKSDTRDVTGCLFKSDDGSRLVLHADDGSTWDVHSDTVQLADHVGHTITATGVVDNSTAHNLKEDAKDAATDAHMKKNDNEHGHMDVTSVQMVSSSCQSK